MKVYFFILSLLCFFCVSCTSYKPSFSYLKDNDVKVCSFLKVNDGIERYGYDEIFDENIKYENEFVLIVVDVFLIENSLTNELMTNLHSYLNSNENKLMIAFSNVTNENITLLLKPFDLFYKNPENIIIYSNFYTTNYSTSIFNSSVKEKDAFVYRILQASIEYIQKYKESL